PMKKQPTQADATSLVPSCPPAQCISCNVIACVPCVYQNGDLFFVTQFQFIHSSSHLLSLTAWLPPSAVRQSPPSLAGQNRQRTRQSRWPARCNTWPTAGTAAPA